MRIFTPRGAALAGRLGSLILVRLCFSRREVLQQVANFADQREATR